MKPLKPLEPIESMEPMEGTEASWWPPGLSDPSNTGGQNGVRYAFFPAHRRLVVEHNGMVKQYDTGGHRITGVSQQQQNAEGGMPTFASQDGPVQLASLPQVD